MQASKQATKRNECFLFLWNCPNLCINNRPTKPLTIAEPPTSSIDVSEQHKVQWIDWLWIVENCETFGHDIPLVTVVIKRTHFRNQRNYEINDSVANAVVATAALEYILQVWFFFVKFRVNAFQLFLTKLECVCVLCWSDRFFGAPCVIRKQSGSTSARYQYPSP